MTFVYINGAMILLNLIPKKRHRDDFGTDGYLLWRLMVDRIRGRSYVFPDTSASFSTETQLANLQGYMPEGFKTGIEILNDNNTTMAFVVSTLTTHLNISREEATTMMFEIHSKGGLLIPMASHEAARSVADAISSDAIANGFKLICRSVAVIKNGDAER